MTPTTGAPAAPTDKTLQSAPLLDDQPSTTDLLNFDQFAGAFERIILNPQTKTPFIIGIFGRWGTGKTTLMRMVERRLEPSGVTTVWFSAWLYNQEEHIWASFLQSLTDRLAERLRWSEKVRFSSGVYRRGLAWTRLLYEMPPLVVRALLIGVPVFLGAALATRAGTKFWQTVIQSTAGAGAAIGAVWSLMRPSAAAIRKQIKPDFSLYRSMDFERHVAFLDRFREQFARIVASLPGANRRVVVFVDDLDRCGPDKTLQLLDAIKVFLDVPGCIFVLGVDISVIHQAIARKYADDPVAQREYLSKIVQLPFHLPPLTDGDLRRYLLGLDVAFPDQRCRGVFLESLSRNPRELKRVINTFSLYWYVSIARALAQGNGVTPVRLAKVIVIQQAYSNLFALLRDQPELLAHLERQFRAAGGETLRGTKSDSKMAEVTQTISPRGVSLPPSLAPYANEDRLARLLTMHRVDSNDGDDASFAYLSAEEILVYFTLTRPTRSRTDEMPVAHVPGAPPASSSAESTQPDGDVSPVSIGGGDALPFLDDRYLALSRLGAGGSSEVYLARDRRTDRRVAIKKLLPTLTGDSVWNERFRREARIAARMTHPNVVNILDTHESADGSLLFVMEFVDGEPFDSVLRREGKLDTASVVRIIDPVFDALAYAHSIGVIHRDIKPSTILIATDGTPKLSDFGLAVDAPGGQDSLTQPGYIVGTPMYMSPEQAMGEALDPRSDLFSLGVVIYEALTGQSPFAGRTATETIVRVVSEHPPAPSTLAPGLSQAADAFVERILAKDRGERFATAVEAQLAFRQALTE